MVLKCAHVHCENQFQTFQGLRPGREQKYCHELCRRAAKHWRERQRKRGQR